LSLTYCFLFPQQKKVAEAPSEQVSHNQEHVSMLMDMGFTANQAKKALGETEGNVERAVEWLFSHPDDDGTTTNNEEDVKRRGGEGSGARHGDRRLPARYKLRGFISHKGPSVFSGHYVAHVRSHHPLNLPELANNLDHRWVLFNDEKVALAERGPLSYEAMAPLAYIYLFERIPE
ncbi:uncharacterized protein VP01_8877g1, partial [Puccinia sorghi]